MAADTEEVISQPPLLRTRREKLRTLWSHPETWKIVLGGAGEFDYIGMIGDLIQEKVSQTPGNGSDIRGAIRDAVTQVWRDHARYEQRSIDVRLLIASYSSDFGFPRLTVVSGAAIREGSDLEAIGIGDSTFRALADRFLPHGMLSTVSSPLEAAEIFTIYAMQQAKLSIPGVGGNTRIVTLKNNGDIKYVKSLAVLAIQDFFSRIDNNIRFCLSGVALESGPRLNTPDVMIRYISKGMLRDLKKLQEELKKIETDDSFV